jgi:PAS domain S-box-containing protein
MSEANASPSSHDFGQAVFDTLGALLVVLDRDGRIVRFNRMCELATGYREADVIGRCVWDLLVPVAEQGPVKERFAALYAGRFPNRHDNHWITKEGQQRLISWSNTALTDAGGEIRYVVATGIDVTEQRGAEEELRRFRAALDATADGVYLIDRANMRYVDANRAAWQSLGFPDRESLLVFGPHDVKPEFSREQLAARFDAILAGADRSGVIETVHRRLDGSTFPVEVFVRALSDGHAPLLVAVARDISERRRVEKALAESRARYDSALRQTHDGFWMVGPNGRLLDVNDAYCRLVGYTREELLSMAIADLEAAETPAEIAAHTAKILAKGSDEFETRHRRKDGTTLPLDVSATSAEFDGQSVLLAFLRSAEPRKRAEAERLAQEREQRDTLVREVHHRIKNNLQGVVGLLRQHSAAHPELRAAFDEAVSQVSAMAVVHGLQSKDGAERIYLCDMVEAVAQAVAGITGVPVSTRTARAETGPIVIAGEEAVPLALIHNELMINAAKHGRLGDGGVRVTVRRVEKGAVVELTNAVPGLPPGFDWDAGRGLGTGLHLVRSLMPRAGARLEFAEHDGFVTATLSLSSPTIVSGQDGSTQVCC